MLKLNFVLCVVIKLYSIRFNYLKYNIISLYMCTYILCLGEKNGFSQ